MRRPKLDPSTLGQLIAFGGISLVIGLITVTGMAGKDLITRGIGIFLVVLGIVLPTLAYRRLRGR